MVRRRGTIVSAALTLVVLVGGRAPIAGASTKSSDVAVARRALIVLSDYPSGWTTSSSSGANTPNDCLRKVATRYVWLLSTLGITL